MSTKAYSTEDKMYTMANNPSFSEWLETQLKIQGISQSELARRAGVTRAAINGVLIGARGAGTELCNGLARALKIPPVEVYRAAGILPPEPPKDEVFYRIETLYHTLREPENKYKAAEFMEFLVEAEEKYVRAEKRKKRSEYRKGESAKQG